MPGRRAHCSFATTIPSRQLLDWQCRPVHRLAGRPVSSSVLMVKVFPASARLREARESMARIYERRQRYDLAIRQYETLYRELGIGALGLLYHLEAARLYEVSGDEAAAVAIYKELNQIDPGSEAANKARVRMEALNLMQKSGDYISKEAASTEAKNAGSPPPQQ